MAEMKHTPGPWEACDQGDYSDFDGNSRVILGDDMRIAVVQWSPGDMQAESDANAHLIAAAPELLAELIALRRRFHNACLGTGSDADIVAGSTPGADAAIARATGAA